MEGPSWLSISWLDAVTRSSWWPILLPFGYGVFRYLEYILKRRQERKPEIERIEQLIRLADLQEKLEKGRMSIAELNILRLQAIGDQVQTAATLSEKYASSAKLLIADLSTIAELYAAKNTKKDTSGKEFGLTQMDMNELSARNAAEAERDLSATIVNLVAHSSEQAVTALQRSQDAWHKYRKAEAEREAQL